MRGEITLCAKPSYLSRLSCTLRLGSLALRGALQRHLNRTHLMPPPRLRGPNSIAQAKGLNLLCDFSLSFGL
jgi:hypothetical protein